MQSANKKTLWKDIKFKYKILIINSNTLEEVARLSISKLNGLSLILFTSLVIFLFSSAIIIFTPLRNYLPGYVNSDVRSQIVSNKVYTDSITVELIKQSNYIENLRSVLSGNLDIDSIKTANSNTVTPKDTLMSPSQIELTFRENYESNEKYNLTSNMLSQTRFNGLNFSRPTYGLVVGRFIPGKNNGIDIAIDNQQNICSILDGNIINTSKGINGYTVVVQHSNNLISIYGNCAAMLKEVGANVKSGEAIALSQDNNNLHLELWYNGKPLDPNKYIAF